MRISGNESFVSKGFEMVQNDFPYKEGDTFSIASWGRLSNRDLAQHGIDVLAGMIMAHHGECPSSNHFWCAPPGMQVFTMAELYQANGKQGEHYIGCYFRGADFDNNGIPSIHERPSLKAVIQRLGDGRVLVKIGRLANEESGKSFGGLGLLDQGTAEFIVVTPVAVADVPAGAGNKASFVFRRLDNVWGIAHLSQDQESLTNTQVRVFAVFPVAPNPSPLTALQIKDFPVE